MKWMAFAIAAALAVGTVGCNTEKAKTSDGTLSITAPTGGVSIKQGESKDISVGIGHPGGDADVTVKLENLPTGVTAEKDSATVKKGESTAKFTLKASDDAKEVTDHKMKATATYKDTKKPVEFDISVKKK